MSFGYGSNYPQAQSGYGAYGGGGGYGAYPPVNSGPPQPQGYGAFGQSAYNNQGGYNQMNQMGNMMGGMMGGMMGMMGGMCQSVQSMHNSYPMGNQPPPQQQPMPQSYTYDPYAKQRMELEMQRQMYQQMGYSKPQVPTRETLYQATSFDQNPDNEGAEQPQQQEEPEPEDTKAIDDEVKERMKNIFINELMRRYCISSSYEMSNGTIVPMMKYVDSDPVDPVVAWKQEQHQINLVGKKWKAEYDAEFLRFAMKGLGTDEGIITYIVSTRCNAQRQAIKKQYKTNTGRDLIEDIKSELSGDYKDAILACFVSPAYYDARSIKKAIYGLGTDEQALIEIFMTRTNSQIAEMKQVYGEVARPNKKTTNTLIEQDIKGDTSGDFKKLLISAAQGGRYEIERDELAEAVTEILNANGDGTGMFEVDYSKLCDVDEAKSDANRLFKAGIDRWGTDEDTFVLVFSTRNFYQLREVYRQYVKLTQADIRNTVDDETSGSFKKGLKAIAESVMNRPRYFANRIKKAIYGLGTDEETLIRIIASRSEIDMIQIKQEYLELTKHTIWLDIEQDCSFNFKKILQALVGKD